MDAVLVMLGKANPWLLAIVIVAVPVLLRQSIHTFRREMQDDGKAYLFIICICIVATIMLIRTLTQ